MQFVKVNVSKHLECEASCQLPALLLVIYTLILNYISPWSTIQYWLCHWTCDTLSIVHWTYGTVLTVSLDVRYTVDRSLNIRYSIDCVIGRAIQYRPYHWTNPIMSTVSLYGRYSIDHSLGVSCGTWTLMVALANRVSLPFLWRELLMFWLPLSV